MLVYFKLFIISIISPVFAKCSSIDLIYYDKTFAVIQILNNKISFCTLYDLTIHQNAIDIAVLRYNKPVKLYNFDKMIKIIEECTKIAFKIRPASNNEINGNLPNITEIRSLWKGIIPGTKWCGLGDSASNYLDLGTSTYFDICCRSHDHCPTRIKPFEFDYGVINLSLYTRSHCKCDELFYKCLRKVNSPLSNLIGNFYFNLINFGCLEFINPACSLVLGSVNSLICSNGKMGSEKVKIVPNNLIY